MLFNSINFLLFLPLVFVLYWSFRKNFRAQNVLLMAASYFFYGCWDYRFLALLVFSTFLDYFSGKMIYRSPRSVQKKGWLIASVVINLGFLGFFKYYNFFATSFADMLDAFGLHTNVWTLQVILPVGISFYTFHGLSYVFDIYKNRIVPTENYIDYSLFVSFFPLLVAGPIERATHLLPQLTAARTFDERKALDGLRQMLWGLFKKVVIADTCSKYADQIFNHYLSYSGSVLVVGAVLFAFQIYCDFSGYSDIALGTARLFGIELLRNFSYPYFSRDIAEFWRRWHISLSSWFRDYLYIPLGGSRTSKWKNVRNVAVIFLVSGFWHGANWTFIAWGALHAMYFIPLLMLNRNRDNTDTISAGKLFPSFRELLGMLVTFSAVVFAWIFFRSADMHSAFGYISRIFVKSNDTVNDIVNVRVWPLIAFLLMMEWWQRQRKHALEFEGRNIPFFIRWPAYIMLTLVVLFFFGKGNSFIYFQF